MSRPRVVSAAAFGLAAVAFVVLAVLLWVGPDEDTAPLRHVAFAYAVVAGAAAAAVGALAGPALIRARSGAVGALGGAGVMVGAAAFYGGVVVVVHLVLDLLPVGLPEAVGLGSSGADGLLGLIVQAVGVGFILLMSVAVGVFTLLAAPLGAGVGWGLWSRARRTSGDVPSGTR